MNLNAYLLENIKKLKENLYSNDWKISLHSSEKLAEINTPASIEILIDALKSNDNFIRNSASLGIREANNNKAFEALFNRIKELGPNEEIGTLVYSLEKFNCSQHLLEITDLYFKGNFEVKNAATTILNEQEFILSSKELVQLKEILKEYNMTLKGFKIKYKLTDI